MYHVDQYTAPTGEYTKVVSADGTQWYKQYAVDAVERKPYMAPDDTVAYHERIIQKLPDPPKRKDHATGGKPYAARRTGHLYYPTEFH